LRRDGRALASVVVLGASLLVAACGSMQGPERLVLGEPRRFEPIAIGSNVVPGVSERESTRMGAMLLRALAQGTDARAPGKGEIRALLQLPRFAAEPGGHERLRGTCVLVQGILGEHSSGHVVEALALDGWAVVIVWPPVVPSIRAQMRASVATDASERGAEAARAVNALLARTSTVAQMLLVETHCAIDGLAGKPIVLVCESMGAIVGVGLAASGEIPFDAALFVAGGGGFIDVARESSLRGILFSELPLEDAAFADAFRATCEFDPLRCAVALRGGPVAVITAERDAVVPIATQEALWCALGEPPRFRWDAGHLELFVRGRDTIAPVVRQVADAVGDRARAAERLYRRVEPSPTEGRDAASEER